MITSIFAYILTIILIFLIINKNKYKTKPFPKLKINKNGIIFYSTLKHKIKIEAIKLLVIENVAYLKRGNTTLTIYNVENVFIKDNYLYFKALGQVKFLFNAENFYRYFNIIVKSNKFSLNKLKQFALVDVLNNIFNLKNSKILKKYLNIVKNILNIDINDKKIEVKANNFNLSFTLLYKINNRIRRVNIQQTL